MRKTILIPMIVMILLVPLLFASVEVFSNDFSSYPAGTALTDSNFTYTGSDFSYSGTGEVGKSAITSDVTISQFNLTPDYNWSIFLNYSVIACADQDIAIDFYNDSDISNFGETFKVERLDSFSTTLLSMSTRQGLNPVGLHGFNHFNTLNLTINRSSRQVCATVNGTDAKGCSEYFGTGADEADEIGFFSIGLFKRTASLGCLVNISEIKLVNLSATAEAPPSDTQNPNFAESSINNSAPKITEVVLLSQVVQDETELAFYSFASNLTGNFINSTAFAISGTSINATFNLTVNLSKGNVIGFIWHVEDTGGNANTTTIDSFTVANTAPESATILAPTGNTASRDFNVTSEADADGDVLTYNYYINGTLNASSTGNVTFTGAKGVYQLNVEVNDGEDSSANATILFTLINTAPETPTIIFPTSGINATNSRDFNVTSPADIDGDILTYNYYINGTLNVSSTGNVTFTGIDGTYQLNVEVNDGEASSSTNATVTFTLDTITPIITITLPLSSSTHSTDIEVDVSCTDSNPFRLNVTMSNSSDIVFSVRNNTAFGSPIIVKDSIDISPIADGDYNFDVICVDTHTNRNIEKYWPFKDLGNLKLFYTTENENLIGIKLKTTTATLDDFGTFKETDRYTFWFGFNELESATVYEYVFKIDSKEELTYLPDSEYNAHFVTSTNWIDFEFDGNDDAIYNVKQTDTSKYEIKILTTKTFLNFRSIGGLNRATESITITIDTSPAVADEDETRFPLENLATLIGMVALLFIILSVLFKFLPSRPERR